MNLSVCRPKSAVRSGHYHPFFDLDRFFTSDFFRAPENAGTSDRKTFVPAVDVVEKKKEVVLKMDLPEVDEKNVEVELNKDLLTIKGERKSEKEEEGDKYYRSERAYGSFTRSFRVPENIDQEKISAEFKKGVLTVRLPRTEEASPRKVEVKVD